MRERSALTGDGAEHTRRRRSLKTVNSSSRSTSRSEKLMMRVRDN
ncbi:hypothetical protein [Scytonema sp. PCC 10023]